jgi:hypothetical protein
MEPMRAQVLCLGAIGRHSRLHHEARVLLCDPAFSATSASSAVTFCPQAVSTAERAELWREGVEPMREQILCLGAIGRRSRFHHEASEYCSVTLLSLRPLRSRVANDKRFLPQSAQSYGEKERSR